MAGGVDSDRSVEADPAASGRPATEVTVRVAVRPDAEVLSELCRAGLEEAQERRGGPLLTRRELDPAARALVRPGGLERLVAHPQRTVLVASAGAEVAGFLSARVEDVQGSPLGVVDFCYVVPQRRRTGVARALLAAALDWFDRAGCLGVDVPALPGDRVVKQWLEASGFTARSLTMHRVGPRARQ